jgi:hypothetical protein
MNMDREVENKSGEETKKGVLHSKINPWYVLIALVVIGIVVLSQYHIVPGTSTFFIKRPYTGFSDIVGSVDKCTGVPYIVAVASHQSLCKALQASGDLESDEARESRIQNEVNNLIQSSIPSY